MRKLLLAGAAALAMVAGLASPANAAWPTNPPPDKIIIDVVTVNGSGCPAGTAAVAVSPDNEAFTDPQHR